MNKAQRLADLSYRPTRYEVIAEYAGKSYLLGYSACQTKAAVISIMQSNGKALLALCNPSEEDQVAYSGSRLGFVLSFGCGLKVRFSGRTERSAIAEGEMGRL